MAHIRKACHTLDQIDPANVVAPEDVALARLAPLGGQQMTGGDVLDVHDVGGAVDDRGQPAAQVVADDPRGRLARLVSVHRHAEHVGGVHHDDLDPAAGPGRERLGLAFVLRVHICEAEPSAPVDVVLPARAAVHRRADAAHAGGEHHALGTFGRRRLDRQARRERVHLPDHLGGARRHHPGAVEDDPGAAEGAPEGRAVEHIGLHGRHADLAELNKPRRIAVRHPNLRPTLREQPGHVGTHEPGRPCDYHTHSGVLVRCSPGETSRIWPCSCRHRPDAAP